MTVGAVRHERRAQGRLEVGVALDPDAARPAGPGDRREVDRPELASRRRLPVPRRSCHIRIVP